MSERRDSKNRLLGKGEYQKSDGRYMYRYTDAKGESRFVYSWTLTQTDRTPKGKKQGKCLREIEKEIAKDLQDEIDTFKAKKMTLNAFYDDYISQKQELKESTRENYKYMYERFVREQFGKRKLKDIKYSDVKKFYNYLILEKGLKPNTADTIHTILHPIFAIAVRDGYIRVNPASGVMAEIKKGQNWERPQRHALTEQEQEVLLNFLRTDKTYNKWYTMIVFLLGTGCRIGEALGLTWKDCDFDNNIININRNLLYRPNVKTKKMGFYISTPKTEAGKRIIPMFKAVKQVLLDEYTRQIRYGFNKSVIDGVSGFIFTNQQNKVFIPSGINKAIDRIVSAYNEQELILSEQENREAVFLPHFSVHSLRHTFCTRMCKNERDIKIIQEIMGHKNIKTTMDIYNEVNTEEKKRSFENLEGKILIC